MPWLLKKSSSPGVRPPIAAPAPAAPPRGPGSDCAKQHVAVNSAARHTHSREALKIVRTFIDTPSSFCAACLREQKLVLNRVFYSCCDRRWTGFLWSRNEVRGVLPRELLTYGPKKVQRTDWSRQ